MLIQAFSSYLSGWAMSSGQKSEFHDGKWKLLQGYELERSSLEPAGALRKNY